MSMSQPINDTQSVDLNGKINTLEDIAAYKARVKDEIRKDEKLIGQQWHSLFNDEERKNTNKWMSLMNTGMGVVDGAILGWKLYRKFKKTPIFKNFG